MPQATALVLANGAATPVNKTFDLDAPAAGFNSVAAWSLREGSISGVFPKITSVAQSSASANKVNAILRVPSSYTNSVTGLTSVGSAFQFKIEATVPKDFPEALKADAIAFSKNLVAHALIQAMIRDGLPAT